MILRSTFFVLLAVTLAHAAEDQVTTIKKGHPKQVAELIDRIVECNHWGGEEAYDSERREQIRRAVEKMRCDALDADEAKLLTGPSGNDKVRQAIAAARKLYL